MKKVLIVIVGIASLFSCKKSSSNCHTCTIYKLNFISGAYNWAYDGDTSFCANDTLTDWYTHEHYYNPQGGSNATTGSTYATCN